MAIKIMQKMTDLKLPSRDVLGVTGELRKKVDLATREAKENKYEPTFYEIDPKSVKQPVYETYEDYDDEKKKANAAKRLVYDKMREIQIDDLEDEILQKYGKENYDDNVSMFNMARGEIKNSIEQDRKNIAEARENIRKGLGKRTPIGKNESVLHGQNIEDLRNYIIQRNEEAIKANRPRREYEESFKKGFKNPEGLKEAMKGKVFGTTGNP
jgi:hypothetical protein